ncbi:MAG TPA: heme o synthase [Saprospiraceae bacterium]|nr:heme o synthase [Saprospiraceae bacterium]HMQ84641.1 heme o synthase [Saprospiraceae bacterium]
MSVKVKAIDSQANISAGLRQKILDYKLLIKFRLTLTVVFSSVMAFLIAANATAGWQSILVLSLGGFLVTAAANTLNQVLEKDYDKLMKRTQDRPLAAGRMGISEAVLAAGFMSMFGIICLALFNPWTAFLGTLSLVLYAFVYTPMKRISPNAVLVGAIPGAMPTLIGVVAAQGELTLLGLSLFALQFLWQFPHFWSIGWLGHEDYSKAGYKMIPTTTEGAPSRSLGMQAFLYALFLLPVGFMPFVLGVSGILSAAIVLILGVCYAWFGWDFYQKNNRKAALRLMFFSFLYIPVSLVVFLLDKI